MKFIFGIVLLFSFNLKADEYLIQQMESLRNSLPMEDPSRIDLTLRLADLYFDVSIREGKETDLNKLKEQRLRSLDLYKHSLEGTHGEKRVTGDLRIKIQFQMARLLSRLDEGEKAEKNFLELYQNEASPKKIKEQSALALAEWYEETGKFEKANIYYTHSISLCEGIPTCNYAHYRLAWLLYKDAKLDSAIAELEKSMWEANGSIRENVLLDYIMFLSNRMSDGFSEFDKIKQLAAKINRPELKRQLMEAFYVAGNRKAGSNTLDIINKEESNIYYEVRLLEEFYGFRNWEKVEEYLSYVEKRTSQDLPNKKEDAAEVQAILRRFLVQLDSEVQVVEELGQYLLKTIDVYLTIYPNDDLRKKMQQGWLKAQKDEKNKIARLEKWIKEDIAFGFDATEIRKLRQTRLSLAQKYNMSDIVILESHAIANILKGTEEAKEFTYVEAHELYKAEKYATALVLFNQLVDAAITNKVADKWSVLAQNLALDIYNKQKDFKNIVLQTDKWLAVSEFNSKELSKENEQMRLIKTQALFEDAANLGETPAALTAFFDFCFANTFADKACPNAKVLAVKLKDQPKLIALLEREKDEKALLVEYELMGDFEKASKLYEKLELNRKASLDIYLKSALLYELALDFNGRDKVLNQLTSKLKSDKKIDPAFESLIFKTLDDANLISTASLSIPWSAARKIALAHRLETEHSNVETQKIIMAQKVSPGPVWGKMVLTKLQNEFIKIGNIGFYGANSKYKFKKRTSAMDTFATHAKEYLEGATAQTRVYILQMLKATYQNLAIELYSTPIPEGLDEETLKQVMDQLAQLAKPFETVAADYEKLQNEQLETLGAEKDKVLANIESGNMDFASFITIEAPVKDYVALNQLDIKPYLSLKERLNAQPENKEILRQMEQYFKSNKQDRLAGYFTGRLNNITQ